MSRYTPPAAKPRGPYCPLCGALILKTAKLGALVCSAHPFDPEHRIDPEQHRDGGTLAVKSLGPLYRPWPGWSAWERRHAECMIVVQTIQANGSPLYNCQWNVLAAPPARRSRKPKAPPPAVVDPFHVAHTAYVAWCNGHGADPYDVWRARLTPYGVERILQGTH